MHTLMAAQRRLKSAVDVLDRLMGPSGEYAWELAWQIVNGLVSYEQLTRTPKATDDAADVSMIPRVRAFPNWSERISLLKFMLEHQNGKAKQNVHVTGELNHAHAPVLFDPRSLEALSPDELRTMRTMLEKMKTRAPASNEVDGELIPQTPETLPEG